MLLKDRVFYGSVVFLVILILIGYMVQYRRNKRWEASFNLQAEMDSTIKVYEEKVMININAADKDDLMRVPGVGEKLAISILKCRDSLGAFTSYDDLLLVKGIGKKKLEMLKKYVKLK